MTDSGTPGDLYRATGVEAYDLDAEAARLDETMTEYDELLDAVGQEQARRIVAALEAELAELRACHDEHYAGMLVAMTENERLRGTLNVCAFDRHTFLLHNADFEVCEDWLCKAARAALKEGNDDRV